MSVSRGLRLAVDFFMAALLLSALAYRITGDLWHELTGLAVLALVLFHNAANLNWYGKVFSGKYGARRSVNTLLNAALIADAAVLFISGFAQSRCVLSFLELDGGIVLRTIHAATGYWFLLLVSAHAGAHWEWLSHSAGLKGGTTFRIFCAFAATCGLWAFFERDMFAKLFLGYTFDFWNPDYPSPLFFLANIAIMGFYMCVVRCILTVFFDMRRTVRERWAHRRRNEADL